jgi:hypothetical protein
MTLNERISKVCEDKKVSQISLVNLGCGSKQTVNSVLHGRQAPNSNFLEVFLTNFKDVKARWLMTGEEEILLEEPRVQYGFCKECIKKEAIIEHLKKECAAKQSRIEELLIKGSQEQRGAESQTDAEKKAS